MGKQQPFVSTDRVGAASSLRHIDRRRFWERLRRLRRFTVNRKLRATLFTIALLLVAVMSLIYSSRALADLIFSPVSMTGLHTQVILKPDLTSVPDTTLGDTRQILARRLDQLNLSGSYELVSQEGQLTVTLPDSEHVPYILDIITHVGEIEFIDGGAGTPPLGQRVTTVWPVNPNRNGYPILFTGQEIQEVLPPDSASGQIFYRLALKPEAADRFADFVESRPRHYICMVVDKHVLNCSGMYHWSDNTLDILPNLGSGTVISLADLAVFLESGPLPVPLRVEP